MTGENKSPFRHLFHPDPKRAKKDETIEPLTEEQKDAMCEFMFQVNGQMARPDKTKVAPNPPQRQVAKIFLNCLWGKLVQKAPAEYDRFIYGNKQYFEFMCNIMVDPASVRFRTLSPGVMKVRYKLNETLGPLQGNRLLNVAMAASVTAHAQCLLMRQMFKIGQENIFYCDTDSIFGITDKDKDFTMPGLGNWGNELESYERLVRFYALAPKSYTSIIEDTSEEIATEEGETKLKGIRQTVINTDLTSEKHMRRLVEAEFLNKYAEPIVVDHMTIHPNSTCGSIDYGTMLTNHVKKRVRAVYSKRVLEINEDVGVKSLNDMAIVRLLPGGYEGEHRNVKRTRHV